MNNLSKLLFFFVLAAIGITSCSKSDDNGIDWAEEQRRRDSFNNARIEALLKEQAPILEDFAEESGRIQTERLLSPPIHRYISV